MNSELLQDLRYKLQKRIRRLNSVDYKNFQVALKQFWGFLNKEPLLKGIEENLRAKCDYEFEDVEDLIKKGLFQSDGIVQRETESKHAALSDCILRLLAASEDGIIGLLRQVKLELNTNDLNASLDFLQEVYLEPFYEYLDEHLDDEKAVIGMLQRYKQRTEWFRKNQVIADIGTKERKLQQNLYNYMHDQGVNFHLEAESSSGRIDFIESQISDQPLLIEVKVFDNINRTKTNIIKGFRQIYDYVKDYNESFGYLVIFKTGKKELKFLTEKSTSGIPFAEYNHKTIFLLQVDLFDYEKPASQRGKIESVEIKEEDFTKNIE